MNEGDAGGDGGAGRAMWLAPLLLALAGCGITPASRYDEATDRLITTMQRAAFGQWERIRDSGTPACRHRANLDYYRQARADAAALAFRAEAIPLNKVTVAQANRLDAAIRRLDAADAAADARGGCLAPAVLQPHEAEMRSVLAELMRLEISKLRNEKAGVKTGP